MKLQSWTLLIIVQFVLLSGCASTNNSPDLQTTSHQQRVQAENQEKLGLATRY